MPTWSIRWIVMLGLLGVVRPRWPHLPLGRSRRAVLDILGPTPVGAEGGIEPTWPWAATITIAHACLAALTIP
jgi:hypothetical protein